MHGSPKNNVQIYPTQNYPVQAFQSYPGQSVSIQASPIPSTKMSHTVVSICSTLSTPLTLFCSLHTFQLQKLGQLSSLLHYKFSRHFNSIFFFVSNRKCRHCHVRLLTLLDWATWSRIINKCYSSNSCRKHRFQIRHRSKLKQWFQKSIQCETIRFMKLNKYPASCFRFPTASEHHIRLLLKK